MGYTAYVEKVFSLLDNGDLEWEHVVGMCLEYMAYRLYERVKEKKYLKKLDNEIIVNSMLKVSSKNTDKDIN